MAEHIDSWEDDEEGARYCLKKSEAGFVYSRDAGQGYRPIFQDAVPIAARHAWLVRKLVCERMKAERPAEVAQGEIRRARFFSDLREEEDLKVHRETIEQQREVIGQLREALAAAMKAAEVAQGAAQKPDRQLVREHDDLARGILELQRKLKLEQDRAEVAEKRYEDCYRSLCEATKIGLNMVENVKAAEGALQTAHNLAEMWRGRYEREKADRLLFVGAAYDDLKERVRGAGHQLPLAYFPAGEDPAARWGLTELGQRALRAGAVKGPAWVLLVSPDPRVVLSIEVRAGSRQETTYRTAGYVSADAATAGRNFLGLMEAFVEVAKANDEELGRAMGYLESLHLFGQAETAAEALFEALHGLRLEWKEGAAPGNGGSGRSVPAYDLAAICARCGEPLGSHEPFTGSLCRGFLQETTPPVVLEEIFRRADSRGTEDGEEPTDDGEEAVEP